MKIGRSCLWRIGKYECVHDSPDADQQIGVNPGLESGALSSKTPMSMTTMARLSTGSLLFGENVSMLRRKNCFRCPMNMMMTIMML